MKKLPSIVTPTSITVCIGGENFMVNDTHIGFNDLRDELKKSVHDVEKIESLISVRKAIEGKTYGCVTVTDDNQIFYKDEPVDNVLVDRMIGFMREGFDIESWALFLDRLMKNPSAETRDELYLWLEESKMPLTEDGCFLAYKKVGSDYASMHTNKDGSKLYNYVGEMVEMPKGDEVDTDRSRTCSYGLHFCAQSYLPHFGWGGGEDRVLILKVDPADVRAIPDDYKNAKGRALRYEVIGEVGENHNVQQDKPAMVDTSTKSSGGQWGWSKILTTGDES